MDKQEVLVIGVKRYSFKNDQGQQVEGTKVHYLDLSAEPAADQKGSIPASVNLPYGEYGRFADKLPAVYAVDFSVSMKGNKPQVKISGMEYVSQAELIV